MNLDRVEQFLAKLPIRDRVSQRLVPFKINGGQRQLHNALKEQQRRKRPMRAIVLKSRRRGISSYTDALLGCHCMARDGTNAMIVTHKFKSSEALFSVPKTILGESLDRARPPLSKLLDLPAGTQHKIIYPHRGGNSFLTIATAGNVEGGRGMTMTDLHLSEVAFYTSANSFAALMPTVPRDPDTIIVLESTANGRVYEGEPFYKFWHASIAGDTEFTPIFLGWLEDPICVDHNRVIDDAPCDDDEKLLMKEFGATLPQIAWRRSMIESPECRGYTEIFDQEYPYCAEVAFISTGDPAFTRDEMAVARSTVQKPAHTGMVLVRHKIAEFKPSADGNLLVWKMPQPGHRYYVGADAARGIDSGDFAAFVVVDGSGEMCARYCEKTGPQALAYLLNGVGLWYNRAMLNVELTGNLGLWTQVVLRDELLYPNLYRWKGSRDDKLGKSFSKTIGWETTSRSREMAMTAFRECLRYGTLIIRDEALVSQMDMCVRRDSFERWDISEGHDDLLMAALLANITRVQHHPKADAAISQTLPDMMRHELPKKADAKPTGQTMIDVIRRQAKEIYNEVMSSVARDGKPDPLEGI